MTKWAVDVEARDGKSTACFTRYFDSEPLAHSYYKDLLEGFTYDSIQCLELFCGNDYYVKPLRRPYKYNCQ